MATWETVKAYLVSNYRCEPLEGDRLKLIFTVDDDRSQVVIVSWAGPSSDQARWLDFNSPLGRVADIDLEGAVRSTADFAAGGLSRIGDYLTLRVSVPLENLDKNEIEEPLNLVCVAGDQLERQLTGADEF